MPQAENKSRQISDAQQGLHKNLESTVTKHLQKPYRKPIAQHTQLAFDQIRKTLEAEIKAGKPLIFDSCCGTAMSTRMIALKNPDAIVVGIDRSAVRLSKEYNNELPENVLLVQAECADFWLLAKNAGWKLAQHKILYPNPYPKSKHLKRRWHGHPAFSTLLSLGGEIELRTNWKVYADEFCMALNLALKLRKGGAKVNAFQAEIPITLFEKKYQEAGQPLFRCKFSL